MYTNRPASSPSAQTSHIDQAQDAASAAAAPAAAASAAAASASASAAGPSAAAAAPPATTRAALISASAAAASASASPTLEKLPEYTPPLHEEMLGIVAGYLGGGDQLTVRSMSPAVKAKTDRQIETLSLSPREAVALFNDTAGLPNLKQLTLNIHDPAGLADFVEALEHARYAPFELVLKEKGLDTSISADVLQRLSVLPLSGLTLHPTYGFNIANVAGLQTAEFKISIDLNHVSGTRSLDVVANLPSLTSLSMGDKAPSPTQAVILGTHPALTAFKTESRLIQPAELLPILRNRHLETLSVNWIAVENIEVIEALAGHPSITTLELGIIQNPALLSAIFQNPVIGSLQLTPFCLHPSVMHHIAEMPSLRTFTLTEGNSGAPAPSAESVRALCTRPLASLSFEGVKLNEATIVIAASAHAQTLTIHNTGGTSDQAQAGTLHQAAIAALVANPHVSSLSFTGNIVAGGAAQLAGAPGLKTLSINIVSAEETVESVQDAWQRANKSLVDLTVSIRKPAA